MRPHDLYAAQRQAVDRALFRYELVPGRMDEIHHATNGNDVLGSARFIDQAAIALGQRVTPGKVGHVSWLSLIQRI